VLDRLRLLFVSNHAYLPQRAGGAEFSTHDLCIALARNGVEVAVLATLDPRGPLYLRHRLARRVFGRKTSKDRVQGYPVYRAGRPAIAITETLGRFAPDVAILHPDRADDLYSALRAARQPTLVYLRDAEFGRLGFVPERAAGVGYVANSHFTASAARAAFGIDATVVPPLIQPERYATTVSGDEVLFVNPVAEKGVDLAFDIAALCTRRRFRFVEGWPLDARRWQALQGRAQPLANVTLQRSSQDMRPVYARARAVIVPSRWQEAWGRIVTEAQLNGIPVLASRIGGLPESVGDGGVLLASTAGAAAWAAEIERLFDEPGHHATMSRRARDRAAAPELTASVLVQRLLHAARGVLDDQ
jgi:glycosyltransferase involved in cell wall biosynthesis